MIDVPARQPILPTKFQLLGGEVGVRAIVDRFYDLMDLEPQFKHLRDIHGPHLDSARDKLFWFLCGWLGGPNHYIERYGHPRLKMRHMGFKIGVQARDEWLACMAFALQDCGVQDPFHTELLEAFFGTADWMRNNDG